MAKPTAIPIPCQASVSGPISIIGSMSIVMAASTGEKSSTSYTV